MNKKIGSYTIETDEIDSFFQQLDISRVFLQLPEGFQQNTLEIKEWFEKTYEVSILLDANPNYGACDLPSESRLHQLDIGAIIQIGHFPIPSMQPTKRSLPILFVNAKSILPVTNVIENSVSIIPGRRVGLVTTAQHLHKIDHMKAVLEKKGFSVVIGTGDSRLYAPGQVLGCNFTAATSIADIIDSFLYVGTGIFHPLGLLLATEKPVIIADPFSNQVMDSHMLYEKKQQILRQRYGAIAFAKQARIIGIIIGLKPGQIRYEQALTLQQKLRNDGKKCLLVAADTITSELNDRFPFVDVFVSMACPRIAIDDYISYKKPILTPVEMEVALQQKDWNEYVFDEIFG